MTRTTTANLNPSIQSVQFKSAMRINRSLTASLEKRALQWMAARCPRWVTSDGLTLVGFIAQLAAGLFYALSRYNLDSLLAASLCLAVNWFGDSMDGTLARVRGQQRPRYGFYVDHMVDVFGAIALMGGLAYSGMLHWQIAMAMLIGFLALACESYLASYTLSRFELSQGLFGPTEIRLLLIAGNLALLHSRSVTLLGHKLPLFDIGGTVGAIGMFAIALVLTARHTGQLYLEEPLA